MVMVAAPVPSFSGKGKYYRGKHAYHGYDPKRHKEICRNKVCKKQDESVFLVYFSYHFSLSPLTHLIDCLFFLVIGVFRWYYIWYKKHIKYADYFDLVRKN